MSRETKAKKVQGDGDNLTAVEAAEVRFSVAFSNITGGLRGNGPVVIARVSIRCRAEADWIAVASGDKLDDNTPVVAFGTGPSMWAALAKLNGAIAAGKWGTDRYRGA